MSLYCYSSSWIGLTEFAHTLESGTMIFSFGSETRFEYFFRILIDSSLIIRYDNDEFLVRTILLDSYFCLGSSYIWIICIIHSITDKCSQYIEREIHR
jgi:hypothetical protein